MTRAADEFVDFVELVRPAPPLEPWQKAMIERVLAVPPAHRVARPLPRVRFTPVVLTGSVRINPAFAGHGIVASG